MPSRSFQNKYTPGTPGTPKIVIISQEDYDALETKDENIIYVII